MWKTGKLFSVLLVALLLLPACFLRKPAKSGKADKDFSVRQQEDGTEVSFMAAYLDAETLLLGGDKEAAFKAFQQLERQNQKVSAIPWRMAEIRLSLGGSEEALVYCKRAMALDPGNLWYKEQHARILERLGKRDLAAAVWEELIAAAPLKTHYYHESARNYLNAGKVDKALDVLNRKEQRMGMRESLSDWKVRILTGNGRHEEAANEIAKLRLKYPDRLKYRLWEARVCVQGKLNDRAINLLTPFLAIDPEHGEASALLVSVLARRGDYRRYFQALKNLCANRAVNFSVKEPHLRQWLNDPVNPLARDSTVALAQALEPHHQEDPAAMIFCGDAYAAVKDHARAIVAYQQALQYETGTFSLYEKLLRNLEMVRDFKEMARVADLMAEAYPTHVTTWIYLGYARLKQFKYPQAEEAIRSGLAFALEGADKNTLNSLLAQAVYRTGSKEDAFSLMEQLIKANPNNLSYQNNYAYLLAHSGTDLNKAFSMMEKVLERAPENPSYIDTYGFVLVRMGKAEQGLPYIEKALALMPDDAEVLEHLGDAWSAMGQVAKARSFWQKALENGGEPNVLKRKLGEGK
jgi:tetratricopeptide (TPR) repeat protein